MGGRFEVAGDQLRTIVEHIENVQHENRERGSRVIAQSLFNSGQGSARREGFIMLDLRSDIPSCETSPESDQVSEYFPSKKMSSEPEGSAPASAAVSYNSSARYGCSVRTVSIGTPALRARDVVMARAQSGLPIYIDQSRSPRSTKVRSSTHRSMQAGCGAPALPTGRSRDTPRSFIASHPPWRWRGGGYAGSSQAGRAP